MNDLIRQARELCAENFSNEYIATKSRTFIPALADALEMAQSALGKQVPIKPTKKGARTLFCPICNGYIGNIDFYDKFCTNCGQAILWEVEE